MMDSISEVKEKLIKEVLFLPKLKVQDKEIDPFIIIDIERGKIRVILNKSHFFGVLSKKNDIQQCLDISLVDHILEHLNSLAEKEQSFYKKVDERKKSEKGEHK